MMKNTKIVICLFALLVGLNLSSTSARADEFKGSLTFGQSNSTNSSDNPLAVGIFAGEHVDNFGDIGLFGNYFFNKGEVNSYGTLGVQIAPDLFRNDWGALMWSNKIGLGSYIGTSNVTLGTGFILEPGSYFHIALEVVHATRIESEDDPEERFPTQFLIGLGFHF